MKRMKKLTFVSLICFAPFLLQAQLYQTVRGSVKDAGSKFQLIGANVVLITDTSRLIGSATDVDGNFRIEKVPVGRHSFGFSSVGYKEVVLNNIIVSSAHEVVLNVELEEAAFALEAIVVTAQKGSETSNEMATVSARGFSVEETDRYAGSRGDPARMASNFAGVQGADDSRNDIVIRGNSPNGVLWRIEGVNIPNPNHFSVPGTMGGPVSIINNKVLANSDFYTGAFPAEFGNSIAGVFDLKFRNGNNQKHEFSGQLGFLGTELAGEGPLSRSSGASYLFTYRYSTLSLFSGLGINIGTNAVPKYQDASFKLNFPSKKGSVFSLFGIGGMSDIDILISDEKIPSNETNIYSEDDRDQYFGTDLGVVGANYSKSIDSKTFFNITATYSVNQSNAHHQRVFRHIDSLDIEKKYILDSLSDNLGYVFREGKWGGAISLYRKISAATSFKTGVNADLYHYNFTDSAKGADKSQPSYYYFTKRWETNEYALLLQPYFQLKHSFSEKLSMNAGLHSQYFSLNNSASWLEPRLGFNYDLDPSQSVAVAFGLHSQIQSGYLYFYAPNNLIPHNRGMDFTKSIHYVASYNKRLGENVRMKAEVYYQSLFNVPVRTDISSFSLLNSNAGFSRFFPDTLQNTGKGKNYGLELTVERSFHKGYYFLMTGSLFESFYVASDNVWRDTDFNGNYAFNGLFSKEFRIKDKNSISLGGKVTTVGGRRYGPVDKLASGLVNEVVYIDSERNTLRFTPYFRADLKVNYKWNRPKVTHEIAIDFVNILNSKNVLQLSYIPDPNDPLNGTVREEYQLGFLPLFYYRLDF